MKVELVKYKKKSNKTRKGDAEKKKNKKKYVEDSEEWAYRNGMVKT